MFFALFIVTSNAYSAREIKLKP